MTTKVCSKCKVEKELGEFSKQSKAKDGLRQACKQCLNLAAKIYWIANLESCRERARKYHIDNPHKNREGSARYKAKNKGKMREANARYRANNPEKVKLANSTWQINNPEKMTALAKKYRDNLVSGYVKRMLAVPNPPQELIELKRTQIRIHREIYRKGESPAVNT